MLRLLSVPAIIVLAITLSLWGAKKSYNKGYTEAETICNLQLKEIERAALDRLTQQTQQVAKVAQDWKGKLDDANAREPDVVIKWMQQQPTAERSDCGLQDASDRQLADAISSARAQYRECSYRLRGLQEILKDEK